MSNSDCINVAASSCRRDFIFYLHSFFLTAFPLTVFLRHCMKKYCIIVFIFMAFYAQSQDIQIPFDNEGGVFTIDQTMAVRMNIFSDYEGFKEARLFKRNDTTFLLQIMHQPFESILRSEKTLTLIELNNLREQLTAQKSVIEPPAQLNQEGRLSYLLQSSIISSFYYGTSMASILSNDANTNLGLYLLTTSASMAAHLWVTRNVEMSMAQASLTTYGQTRGILHGMLLPSLIFSNPDHRTVLSFGVLGSVAEAFLGYRWATKHNLNHGQTIALGTFGDFGMLAGLGIANTLGAFEGDLSSNFMALSALSGAAVGLFVGNHIANRNYYTYGDGFLLSGAASLGILLPISVLSYTETPFQLATLIGTAGLVGGLAIGDNLAKKYEFSDRQGMHTLLYQCIGSLAGLGISSFLGGDESIALIGTSVGTLAGFLFAINKFGKQKSQSGKSLQWKFNFNPAGLLTLKPSKTAMEGVSLVSGSLRF